MFSDIVGYTALMGRDEREGLRAVREHREHLRAVLPQFNGRLIGEIGDGTLSSFHSAVDAVNCARELQATLVENPELRLRIGIHVGDVVFTDKTVLGDGVNIASRIHELAPPGGCCISERVYEEIRNKPEFHVQGSRREASQECGAADSRLCFDGGGCSRPTSIIVWVVDRCRSIEASQTRDRCGCAADHRDSRHLDLEVDRSGFRLVAYWSHACPRCVP